MEQIIITVENKDYGDLLLKLLKELNFVKGISVTSNSVSKSNTDKLPESKFVSKSDFWETFGTGKDTSVNINFIKEKAWRTVSL